MLSILGEKIHDGRFLRLISQMLKAGYLEDWRWNATLSGAPQGGVVSPLLSNVYLDRLDQFIEQVLLPEYNSGSYRRRNPEYGAVRYRGGDRQLNRALHTIVLTRSRTDPATRAYINRRLAEGKTLRDIKRCLKRIVARQLFRLLQQHHQRGGHHIRFVLSTASLGAEDVLTRLHTRLAAAPATERETARRELRTILDNRLIAQLAAS
ncbi:hypothetical protein [Saccharopolyspora sp. NPDC050642]|uniref:hypothetical protein n=1 Tax=Saccharopolyspora sp. NPDC050642 TaxID=3157099 RepID=UPI0033E04E28